MTLGVMRPLAAAMLVCSACSVTTNLDGLQCSDGACGGQGPASDAGTGASTGATGGGGGAGHGGAGAAQGSGGGGDGGGGGSARCDKTKPFQAPVPITELDDTSASEFGGRLMPDERTIFFTRTAPPGKIRIFTAARASTAVPFGPASVVQKLVGSEGVDAYPSITADGLTIYFYSDRTMEFELFQASRSNPNALFETPEALTALNTPTFDARPYVSPDGAFLLFVRGPSQTELDLWQSAWNGVDFSPPEALGIDAMMTNEADPVVTSDGLTVYFASDRGGGLGGLDLWRATRTTPTTTSFDIPVVVAELDTAADETPNWISPDECSIYLQRRNSGGAWNLYRAVRSR